MNNKQNWNKFIAEIALLLFVPHTQMNHSTKDKQ